MEPSMRITLSFGAALLLAAGCAHQPQRVTTIYNYEPPPGTAEIAYGPMSGISAFGTDYDNSSKGAGARALMQKPAEWEAVEPVGAAVVETETGTSQGAGGRALRGEQATS